MSSDKSFKIRLLFAVGDVFHLVLSLLISYRLTFFNINLTDNYIFLNIIVILSWLVSAHFFNLFNYERGARIEEILLNFLKPSLFMCSLFPLFCQFLVLIISQMSLSRIHSLLVILCCLFGGLFFIISHKEMQKTRI